jgi:S-adenosylmethionine/arginine decarboxylase-like enzyme
MSNRQTSNFGEHLIFDAYGCDYQSLSNMETCYDVLNKLVVNPLTFIVLQVSDNCLKRGLEKMNCLKK